MGSLVQLFERACLLRARVLNQHDKSELKWAPRIFSRGVAGVAACYKTRRVFCPAGQLKGSCSILFPTKLVWLLFFAVAKE